MLAVRKRYVDIVYGYDMKSANPKMHDALRPMSGKIDFLKISFQFCDLRSNKI